MRSLFWKIFLFFWLAMTLIGVAFGWLYITRVPHIKYMRKHFMARHAFYVHGKRVVRLLQSQQAQEAQAVNLELEQSLKVRAYVFQGDTLLASPWKPPTSVRRLARQALTRSKYLRHRPSSTTTLFAVPLSGCRQQNNYVVVGVIPHPSRLEKYIQPKTLFWRVLILFIITGFICYLLARYLTRPIRRLQITAQRLAQGDLEARVDPEVRQLRDEVGELAHDFDLMAERIKQLLETQKRLVRDISHELRSPLARLYVALELTRQKTDTSAHASLDRIELEAGRLNELIGQLLTLSQLESGNRRIQKEAVDLQDLLQQVIQDANFEAQGRQRSVQLRQSEQILIQGDTELLRRAIENVVRNAIRFTPEHTTVDVRLWREQHDSTSTACLEVHDHGPGVPETALTQLFQPFYQVEEARTPHHEGKGLGLAITQRSVHLHDGTIQAINAKDGGLTVKICLPCE